MKIRLTKEFDFETAHALDLYAGKCKDIHGHSYHLRVTVIGEPIADECMSNCGMVVDFGDIKQVVRDFVYEEFDHRLLLKDDSRFKGIEEKNDRVRYVTYHPTCENMLIEIVTILKEKLPSTVSLHSVFLRETHTSYAEWFATDQK
jgi:6-pyruvoyltetrahydropterin/6-carboxytetrahydropterin synthase